LILLIDDDEIVRDTVTDILQFQGIPVRAAADGPTGIAIYRAHQRDILLVLLDFFLPGLGSVETLNRLRAVDPNVRVALSSGYGEAEVMRRFAGLPVAGFLRKPYTATTLLNMIRRTLMR
jgi:CheY-like chemotaxis protein